MVRFELVPVEKIREHEEVQEELLRRLTDAIRRDGYMQKPLLVAAGTYVILDGHHRLHALRNLGCARVPAYLIDYFSDLVTLTTWDDSPIRHVTKEEVVERALAGRRFPPKTTRHRITVNLEDRAVALKDLY